MSMFFFSLSIIILIISDVALKSCMDTKLIFDWTRLLCIYWVYYVLRLDIQIFIVLQKI